MTLAVRATGLGRVYAGRRGAPDTVALADVDLAVDRGEIHGLLGPNGAGKSTLVKILSTVLLPTTGSATVLDRDVVTHTARVREVIGVVFGGERGLYPRISARQNLLFFGTLYRLDGRPAPGGPAELRARGGLADRAQVPIEQFSRGMKQRLHLARGLLHDPQVLFLDEPTSGLDPVAAREFRVMVRQLRQEGRTVFLTTHDMAEATALCDRVTLIDRGHLLLTEATGEVGRYLGVRECIDVTADRSLLDAVAALPLVDSVVEREERDGWRVFPARESDTAAVLRWFVDHGVLSARRSEPSLEEVYLRLIGTRGMGV